VSVIDLLVESLLNENFARSYYTCNDEQWKRI